MSDDEVALLQEQLGEARAEVERLQTAAADSEAQAGRMPAGSPPSSPGGLAVAAHDTLKTTAIVSMF